MKAANQRLEEQFVPVNLVEHLFVVRQDEAVQVVAKNPKKRLINISDIIRIR